MQLIQRTILLVVESLGVGEAPDAIVYGDLGANTLAHITEKGQLTLPTLSLLGLGNLTYARGLNRNEETVGFFGKMRQRSDGKDNRSGHWEIAGVNSESLFVADPDDYIKEIAGHLQTHTGLEFILAEKKTQLDFINRYGEEHLETGNPILFYEEDLTLTIACHEKTPHAEKLPEICRQARDLCDRYGVHYIQGVYFNGQHVGSFRYTGTALEFPMQVPRPTLLNDFRNMGIPVNFMGTTSDIFPENEIDETSTFSSDRQLMESLIANLKKTALSESEQSLTYVVLNEIDRYAHQRDPEQYIVALKNLDAWLPRIFRSMNTADMLIITASHGNDPLHKGALHTREYLPLMVYSRLLHVRTTGNLGVRRTLSDIAETLSEIYSLGTHYGGESFWNYMISQI